MSRRVVGDVVVVGKGEGEGQSGPSSPPSRDGQRGASAAGQQGAGAIPVAANASCCSLRGRHVSVRGTFRPGDRLSSRYMQVVIDLRASALVSPGGGAG